MNFIRRFMTDNKHPLLIGAVTFIVIYTATFVKGYGFFIDEFYYIACAAHPAFGYVDHPPLAPFILTIWSFFFGTSLAAIRILPALAMAGAVVVTGLITKEIGGGRFSQVLAACSLGAAPTIAAFGGFYSMNAFEPLLAALLLYFTIRMIKENNPRKWIGIGVLMGLGMMNKHTFALFIIALVIALAVGGKWRLLFNKWFIIGGMIGLVLFLPNIIWQIVNNYPSLEFYRNISTRKNVFTPPAAFIMGQVLSMSPAASPVWLAGIVFLLVSKSTRDFRFLSIIFILIFSFLMFTGTSRSDRLMFAYPAVFAGGAMFFEGLFAKRGLGWLKGIAIVFLYTGLAVSFPLVLPCADYETVRSWTAMLGLNTEIEHGNKPPLPQLIADRIGWEEKCDLMNRAWQSLSDEDKKQTIMAAGNYGQAGALELYGKKYGFPAVVCAHNNYYLWSKERLHGSILLQMDHPWDIDGLKKRFEDVRQLPGEYTSDYVTSHENHLVIFICRNPKMPYSEMLEKSRIFY